MRGLFVRKGCSVNVFDKYYYDDHGQKDEGVFQVRIL